MDMSQYMSVFIDESREHLQLLNDAMLRLEKDNENLAIVEEIFRSAHTLKGMSATMGFSRTAELTHDMENILDSVRHNKLKLNSDIVDLLFECLDMLNLLTEEVIQKGEEISEIKQLAESLDKALKGEKSNSVSAKKETKTIKSESEEGVVQKQSGSMTMEFNEFEKQVIQEGISKGLGIYFIKIELDEGCLLKAARTYMVFRTLEDGGEIIKSLPTVQELEEEKFDFSFLLAYITDRNIEEIKKNVLSISEIKNVTTESVNIDTIIEQPHHEEEKKEIATSKKNDNNEKKEIDKTKEAPKQAAAQTVKTSTVRVDTEKLDSLMNLVAELVINKTRLAQIGTEYNLQDLSETLSHIDRVTADLQAVVTKVRMVPIENVFNRFPRMIRDMSRELDKEIDLVIEGKETELDRTVIDEIGDPLVHLIRNSLDHGIEKPDLRESNGKPRHGTILLKAEHEGNNVVITISDDGKGMDPKVIGQKAVEKGIITQEEYDLMNDGELVKLIFAAGFSTAEQITDISGRGVGMDVVKNKIEGLNGQIEVITKVREGTTTRVKLPLTLAIIEALLVKLKEEIYAVPLANIVETIDILEKDIKVVQNEDVIVLRGELVPIVNLGKLLEVEEYQELRKETKTVVIVKAGSRKIGFIVDYLIGQQEIVIKPLGKLFTGIKGITGATVLGNGEVALILDVLTLL